MSIRRGAALICLVLALVACADQFGRGASPSSSPTPSPRGQRSAGLSPILSPTSLATASPSSSRPVLPVGFPLMPGAEATPPLPEDASVVGRWTVPVVGSAAYDFYVQALPGAGFSIVGSYPSERAALIRFRDRSGRIWQVLAELVGDQTQITVQTDRP